MNPTEEAQTATPVQFDARQNYACTNCPAKCCRLPWNITLKPEEVARYRQTPWIVERLQAVGKDFVSHGEQISLPRVVMPDGGTVCPFLDEDNLCSMQKREGHAFIPLTCQEFPFSMLVDARRDDNGQERIRSVQAVTSMVCRSILHNYGEPLDGQVAEKHQAIQTNRRMVYLPQTLQLAGVALAKDQYLVLFEAFEDFFRRPELTAARGLLAMREIVWRLAQDNLGRETCGEESVTRTVGDVRQLSTDALEPAEKARGTLAGNTLIALHLIPLVLDSEASGRPSRWKALKARLDFVRQKGTYPLWGHPRPVVFEQARQVTVPEADPVFQSHLKRYYASLFYNKVALMREDLLQTSFLLAVSYPAILRAARFHAWAHGRSAASEEDLLEGIGFVDLCLFSTMKAPDVLTMRIKDAILAMLSARPDTFARVLFSESAAG